MPLFTMESYLATEASVFLRAKYEDVPKQMLGSVFYMSRFVENLLGKQEEDFTQQHAAAQFNELLRNFQQMTATLLNHLVICHERVTQLELWLREQTQIPVHRKGHLIQVSIKDAADKEIHDFFQGKYEPKNAIKVGTLSKCRLRVASKDRKRFEDCLQASRDAIHYVAQHGSWKPVGGDSGLDRLDVQLQYLNEDHRFLEWILKAANVFGGELGGKFDAVQSMVRDYRTMSEASACRCKNQVVGMARNSAAP